MKEFFQRLQQGLPLRSSERLNAVDSALRNFCRRQVSHDFFKVSVNFSDKRYAYFDVVAKTAAIEIEGLGTGLRFDDLKELFENQSSFSVRSAAAKRLTATLGFLVKAFPQKVTFLRNRSVVQSFITLASRIVSTGKQNGKEKAFAEFAKKFMAELLRQVELGLNATDPDYLEFQRSVNANVKEGARTRHSILMRKMFQSDPSLSTIFEIEVLAEAGLNGQVKAIGERIAEENERANESYAAKHGKDLFKATNKTSAALRKLQKPIGSYAAYKELLSDLYFLLWEGTGERLKPSPLESFKDVNALRTDLQHDLDHGKPSKVKAKRKDISAIFGRYGSGATPRTLAPEHFVVVQLNLLGAIDRDLRGLIQSLA